MGIFKRNRTFLVGAVLILVVGALLFGGVIAVRVMAESSATPAPAATQPASYNSVSSYGMTGYAPLTLEPTAETPDFITKRLDEKPRHRPARVRQGRQRRHGDALLLQRHQGATTPPTARSSPSRRASPSSSATPSMQLRVSDPPILAIIRGDGTVANLYTGWIGFKVMEQEIADAVRGL